MKFWDSSAILPICLDEPHSDAIRNMLRDDQHLVVWWGTIIECWSALSRLRRERILSEDGDARAREILRILAESWTEVEPTEKVRQNTARLLRLHPLRAADAAQLAAGLVWAEGNPAGHAFVCLDKRLSQAAGLEGFHLLPATTR